MPGSFFRVIREAKTVEDFICAVADLGDPETGELDDWDLTDMSAHMEEIITAARRFQRPMDSTICRLTSALQDAEVGLRSPEKSAGALASVREALRA